MDANIDNLDIVITATLRPELIDLTLASFFKNLLKQFNAVRLIINIDPVGDHRCNAHDILSISRRYAGNIVHRCPEEPSFSSAVKWCWEQVETQFFLHLEDDWLLKKPVSKEAVLGLFDQDCDIATVRFNRSTNSDEEPVSSPCFSLNPSIMRKEFIDEALPFFRCDLDPEKQFCILEGEKEEILSHWKFVCYGSANESSYVIDTGRRWRKFMNFGKWQHDSGDISWQRRQMTHFRFAHYLRYKASIWYWICRHHVLH
ncbi:MAG: hypothetical protein L0226_03505 [Acidobacteria bacterium]|nr:hypothetical protein [Acidobacteriota bacterium]